jgi:catechol 2,3-dioxygenase-like lactoylglutathione lyase family enzyme
MQAMVEFYGRLGVDFTPTVEPWDQHHRTFGDEAVIGGFDFDLDSMSFVQRWNQGWPEGKAGPVFGFRMPSPESVDQIYQELVATGYRGQQPPWDGFMGARYAVVEDPDGNAVGLMGPIDPERRTVPDPP